MRFERRAVAAAVLIVIVAAAGPSRAQTMTPTTKPTTRPLRQAPSKGPPDMADPKHMEDGSLQPTFKRMHESFLARAKEGPIGVLFLGDSITEGWRNAKTVWKQYYEKDHPANFGIGGDRTEHVLWRIDNGELDGISPKVLVLMIGTNNVGGSTAEQIAKADLKIVSEIHQKLPNTKVLVLGIFPRGHDPKDPKVKAMRDKIDAVNAELAKLDGTPNTTYLDIGPKFLDKDGVLQPEIMKDYLHPTYKGYEVWAAAMQPTLDGLLK